MTDKFKVEIRVTIRKLQTGFGGGHGDAFSVDEQLTVGAEDFMEVAKICGQFHDLAEQLRVRGQE